MEGVILSVVPVHASSAFRCASFQSVVPSSCNTAKEVMGDFVDINAPMGEVAVTRWYKKGMPTRARRRGERNRSVETTSSGVPVRPTREPRRVYRSCDGESETESRE